jgi:CHAT domain-containing protein
MIRPIKSAATIIIVLLTLLISAGGAAIKVADVPSLEQGKPIERELAGGEAHSYLLLLAAGQYARVVVDQRRINVAVTAFDPDGKKIVDEDATNIGDSELVPLIAETAGAYRLEVRSPDKSASKGRYEIKVKELRAATEQDKSQVAAERLIAEGLLLESQPTREIMLKVIEKFQQSIPLCRSAKDPACEAMALYLISDVYVYLGEKQKALDFSTQALPLAQAAAKHPDEEQRRLGLKVEANTLMYIGRAHNEFGETKKALEFFNQALPLWQAVGDRTGEATTLGNIGAAYQFLGDYQKAFDIFNRSLVIARELRDRTKEGTLLNNICVIHNYLGQYKQAIDSCNQALSIRHELRFQLGEATTLNNLANTYTDLGEYQKALDSYTRSHAIYKVIGSRSGQGVALNNIGRAYATLGEFEKAIGFYDQALEIFRAEGDQYREANVLGNMAANYADMGDFRKALEINQQVLPLRRAQDNRAGEAITLNNIAYNYSHLGEKQKAIEYYNQSIALHRKVGDPGHMATALRNIGALYRELGENQRALDYFNEALQLARTIGERNNEAAILAHIARVERDRGSLVEARNRIEAALAAVESLRINIKSQQLRASYFASVSKYQEFNIDLLMRLHKQRPSEGFDAAALQASEKSRARSLLELLKEARAEIRQGVDPVLLERERTLRQMISEKADRQMRLLRAKHTEEQAEAAAKEVDTLTTDYEQVQAQIRQTSPRYAALTEPALLTLKQIQTEVLDDETLLLEYTLGEERSYLWAVTPSSIKSFELPKRSEIESAARRVYEILTARNRTSAKETLEQRRKRIAQAEAEFAKTSLALSQILLGPVAAELKGKRLVIVGEGMLQYTAFAALPSPDARPGVVSSPLIVDHEIISLPSASVLAVLRREAAGRKTPDKIVAVFADPVFDSGDPRIGLSHKNSAPAVEADDSASDVKRSATESGLQDFERLRFSRQEADQIVRFAPEGKRLSAVDFAASRASATSPELDRYSIIHFATHGLINNQHPELSGVVLSLVDEQGRPQDGFLRLYDIYNLKLQANLVVLSACQTALGKQIKGEGLVGLTRGFMYAGAPRVVASLWQVDDRATAQLMGRFYEAMLGQGLRPAAALRAAQVAMWKDKRWQGPHYWAAFTLQGEWR